MRVAEFFLEYRTVDLKPTEVVECVQVPILDKVFEYLKPFKQARRREDDISIVTSGMRIKLCVENGKFVVQDVALAFGGMAPTTVVATETAHSIVGQEFCAAAFEAAGKILLKELALPDAVPGRARADADAQRGHHPLTRPVRCSMFNVRCSMWFQLEAC